MAEQLAEVTVRYPYRQNQPESGALRGVSPPREAPLEPQRPQRPQRPHRPLWGCMTNITIPPHIAITSSDRAKAPEVQDLLAGLWRSAINAPGNLTMQEPNSYYLNDSFGNVTIAGGVRSDGRMFYTDTSGVVNIFNPCTNRLEHKNVFDHNEGLLSRSEILNGSEEFCPVVFIASEAEKRDVNHITPRFIQGVLSELKNKP